MKRIFKGFLEYLPLVSNNPSEVSLVGELSPLGKTFRREVTQYGGRDITSTNQYETMNLWAFTDREEVLNSEGEIDVTEHILLSQPQREMIFQLGVMVYQVAKHNLPIGVKPVVFTPEKYFEDVLTAYQIWFAAFNVDSIYLGPSYSLSTVPAWITITVLDGTDTYNYKIWFRDQDFQKEYDDYDVVIVSPVKNANVFFTNPLTVQTEIDAFNHQALTEKIAVLRENHPETILRTFYFEWRFLLDPDTRVMTPWTAIVYGPAGNDYSIIRDAIRDHLDSEFEDDYTLEDKEIIFPEIYLRTEFLLVPLWANMALPAQYLTSGVYSPIVTPGDDLESLTKWLPYGDPMDEDDEAFVMGNYQVTKHPLKSVAILSLGHHRNIDEKYRLSDLFPDYIAQNTESQDFNRQSIPTQQWAERLNRVMILAETDNPVSVLPQGVKRRLINGGVFLVFSFERMEYFVKTKAD